MVDDGLGGKIAGNLCMTNWQFKSVIGYVLGTMFQREKIPFHLCLQASNDQAYSSKHGNCMIADFVL